MNTSVRARHDVRGFSFIELLVTIIIAGIAFAAIVPLFVMAESKNVDDNFRTSALTLAQDKLERVRQLDYTQIVADKANPTTVPNLYNGSSSFSGGQFGSTWAMQGGGSSRTLYIDYVVTPYPATATGIQAQYKEVQVTVTWDAPPVVKPVVLKTIVYKQYAGPTLLSLSTQPEANELGIIPGVGSDNNPGVVTLRAVVDQGWINQTAKVQFSVALYGGATVASGFVKLNDAGDKGGGVFEWLWDATTAANGVYDLKATAISSSASSAPGFAGNTTHIYPRLAKVVVPDPPAGLTATNGNGFVKLTWNPSGGDLLRYEVYKSVTLSSGPWEPVPWPAPENTFATYTDNAVTNGESYWYAVKTVTTTPLTSNLSAAVQGLPKVADSDSLAPSAPAWISCAALTGTQTIQLAWQASTDYGAPPTGVGGYWIWRSADQVAWTNVGERTDLANLAFNDSTAGYNMPWFYKVQPFDKAVPVNATPLVDLTAHSATTGPMPTYTLTLENTENGAASAKQAYVWIWNQTSMRWVDQAGTESITRYASVKVASSSQRDWTKLPAGPYKVYVRWGDSSWPIPNPSQDVSIDHKQTTYVLQ